jgi:hypothetical protein
MKLNLKDNFLQNEFLNWRLPEPQFGFSFIDSRLHSLKQTLLDEMRWTQNHSLEFGRIIISFDQNERSQIIKKYITLLLCIRYNKYVYPAKEIRKMLFKCIFKCEKDYEKENLDRLFGASRLICAKYNTNISFYTFCLCLHKLGYSLPYNSITKIHSFLFEYYGSPDRPLNYATPAA